MRLFSGVPAARRLLVWRFAGFACVVLLRLGLVISLLLAGRALVSAQAAPKQPSQNVQNVMDAPPPAPPLTEQDEATPPAAAEKPAAAPAKPAKPARAAAGAGAVPASSRPATRPNNGPPAAAASSKPALTVNKPAAAAPSKPAVSASKEPAAPSKNAVPSTKPLPAADSGVATAAAQEDDDAPALVAPPRPSLDGDFAGRGGLAAADAGEIAPQDDFAAEAQEYVRPNKREYSVRIDLLNWLLLGRLSVELEVSVWKYITLSLTPVFVLARSPIAINYAGLDDPLTQHSHGIGPLSGVSLGVGAWFWGEPFKGYVLRLEFTNYSYSYRTENEAGPIDRVDFTERRLILFIGSHSRFGAFTFAGGFGLGYELNQQTRCGLSYDADDGVRSRSEDCSGKQQIALDREIQERANLNGPLHPVYFQARFSIGVVF